MRERILDFLKAEKGRKYSVHALSKALDIESADAYKTLAKTVNALEAEALIMPNTRNEYTLIEYTDYVAGTLDVKAKGFAFLLVEGEADDIYIPPRHLQDAMDGDRVLVHIQKSPKGFKKEGDIVRILERYHTHLIGTVIKRGKRHHLKSDNKSINNDILIPKTHLNGAQEHDKVRAKIINYSDKDGRMICKVSRVIGNMNEPGVDIYSKILTYDIDPDFPEEVLAEAKKHQQVQRGALEGRRDLTDRQIVTIDGEDAKDFDDAVEVERREDGYYLGVHIADVSHYVRAGNPLDEEAYERGTSIYLVDRVIPMLPEALSNNICSLMPDVLRLTLSCDMIIDFDGRVVSHEIYPSYIRSKGRLTYEEVNAILDGDEALKAKRQALLSMIESMEELAGILRERRTKMGSLHFETDETDVTLDKSGRAVNVRLKPRGKSERFIEEFMLVANKTVAEHVYWMDLPFIYRVHESPKEEKLEKLLVMANALGFKVKGRKTITNQALQRLLQKVEDTASEQGINMMTLRAMQKAIYQSEDIGHFGLAFDHYTHFTSPIRRYPDLIVHRLLREYFFKRNQSESLIDYYDAHVDRIADHSSERERRAVNLERDVLDMKKAEYMQGYIGETFKGHVSSVTGFGLYVTLPNTVEGLVHISELDDDYYVFDEDRLMLIGRHKRKIYRIGDDVAVQVNSVNVFDGEVDFTLAGGE